SCVIIPESFLAFHDGVSGIWTKGTCVVAYSFPGCEGNQLIMKPGTLDHGDLRVLGFDNMAQSVGPCDFTRVEKETTIRGRNIVS
ncbi:hypothetical protein PMAYCL1PPCAC_21524, partial [Pristionchus mayeri]